MIGDFPEKFGNLILLETLDVFHLTFPQKHLFVNIDDNNLSSLVPVSIYFVDIADTLFLSYNSLTKRIPFWHQLQILHDELFMRPLF